MPPVYNTAAHEMGHIFGVIDYYDGNGNPMLGWEDTLMGGSQFRLSETDLDHMTNKCRYC